ncbi:MAG TPA: TRAP transporter small permease, partial [Octadecabacter sp.]|nr:TRAP transporter small permease [Octadecabacter sp.]
MQFLVNLTDRISQVLMAIAIALAAVMMLHVTLDVILSQFIAEPMPMTVDLVSFYYMVGLVFLPLAFVETKNEHIDVDLIHAVLPKGGKMSLDLVS